MEDKHNHFKTNFEELAATKFLDFYNSKFGCSFEIVTPAPKEPDFHCRDAISRKELKFDVTLATVAPRDPMAFRQMLDGNYKGQPIVSPSFDEELATYKEKIEKKFTKRYGKDCALVVFHMGLVWEWDEPAVWESPDNKLCRLKTEIDYNQSPFDKGIWFLSWEHVYCLHEGKGF